MLGKSNTTRRFTRKRLLTAAGFVATLFAVVSLMTGNTFGLLSARRTSGTNSFTAATLTAPGNVTTEHDGTGLTTNNGGVTTNWAANNHQTGYTVSRAPLSAGACGTFASVGTPTTTTYDDKTAVYNTSYCYHANANYDSWTSPNSSPDNVALSLAPSSISDATSGGSTSWVQQTSPTTQDLNAVSALDSNHVWAVGANNGGTTDTAAFYNGTSWSNQSFTVTTGKALLGVSALDSSHVWAVGQNLNGTNDNAAFFNGTSWAQQTFTVTTGKNLNAVSALDSTHVWAVGDNINSTTDQVAFYNGTSWAVQPQTVTSGQKLLGVVAIAANDVWAVGMAGWVGNFNGTSWTFSQPAGIGASVNLTGVDGTDSSHVWATAASGAVYFFNGTSWAVQSSAATADSAKQLNGIAAVDSSDVWAVGNNISAAAGNAIFYNGSTWALQTLTTSAATNFSGVSASDANHVWAVAAGGVIYFRGLASASGVALANDSSTYTTAANWGNSTLPTSSCPTSSLIMPVGVAIPAGSSIDNVQATLYSESSAAPSAAAREQVLVSGNNGTTWSGPTVTQTPAGTSLNEQTFDLSSSWNGLSSPSASQMEICVAASTGGGTAFTTTFDLVHVDADSQPDVTASPLSGVPGTSVTMSGTGFAHSSAVTISLTDSSGTTFSNLASSTSTNTGALQSSFSFNVPGGVAVGAGHITVTDGSGLSGSTTFTVSPYASTLVFTNQVSSGTAWGVAASPMAPQPTVAAEDSLGDIITSYTTPITLTFSGTGTFSCTSTTVTPVNGVATFANCKMSATGASDSLTAASGTMPNATSNTFTIASAPTIAGITFVNASHTGTTCSTNTFPSAVCANTGNGGTGTFSFEIELASGGTPLAPTVTTTNGPILVTATYTQVASPGATTGPTSEVVAASGSATTIPFTVTGLGGGWQEKITCTVTIGANTYTFAITAS